MRKLDKVKRDAILKLSRLATCMSHSEQKGSSPRGQGSKVFKGIVSMTGQLGVNHGLLAM